MAAFFHAARLAFKQTFGDPISADSRDYLARLNTADNKHSANTVVNTRRTGPQRRHVRFGPDFRERGPLAAGNLGFQPPYGPHRLRNALNLYNTSFPLRLSTSATRYQGKSMSRRRGFKRRRYTRRGLSFNYRSDAKQALKIAKRLERKVERKMVEIGVASTAVIGATGIVTRFALIAQGDGISSRQGNHINPTQLVLNFRWIGEPLSTNDVYRTIIFRDNKQILDTDPPVVGVLREARVMSLYALENRRRFRILYDQCFSAPGDAAVTQSFVVKLRLKLTGRMSFQTSVASSILDNGLYMLNISNLAGAFRPTVEFTSRMYYTDT